MQKYYNFKQKIFPDQGTCHWMCTESMETNISWYNCKLVPFLQEESYLRILECRELLKQYYSTKAQTLSKWKAQYIIVSI